jgi:hypothetical protein
MRDQANIPLSTFLNKNRRAPSGTSRFRSAPRARGRHVGRDRGGRLASAAAERARPERARAARASPAKRDGVLRLHTVTVNGAMANSGASPAKPPDLPDFDALIASSASDLTLGNFAPALATSALATSAASTPLQRAAAAVLRIQCLQECGKTSDALALATASTGDPAATHLSHDLALTAASLALHAGDHASGEGMLRAWLDGRLAEGGRVSRDGEVVRMYVLRVVKAVHGPARGAEVLERAAPILSEDEYLELRAELVDGEDGVTEIASPGGRSSRRSTVAAREGGGGGGDGAGRIIALPRSRGDLEEVVRRLGRRLRAWLGERGETDQRVAVCLAVAAAAAWVLARPRGRRPSFLRVLRASVYETLAIALGRGAGRWAM